MQGSDTSEEFPQHCNKKGNGNDETLPTPSGKGKGKSRELTPIEVDLVLERVVSEEHSSSSRFQSQPSFATSLDNPENRKAIAEVLASE